MRDGAWIWIAGYLIGAAVAGRVAFVLQVNARGRSDDGEETFMAFFAAVFWPVVVPLGVLWGLIAAVGWALSRPTRRERVRAAEQRRAAEREEADRLAREYQLPGVDGVSHDR